MTTRSTGATAASRIAELETALATERIALAMERDAHAAERDAHAKERGERKKAEAERDRLRAAYDELKIEADLAKHRITIAKAERIDTTQLEIEFATKLAELDDLAGMVSDPAINAGATEATPSSPSGGGRVRRKGATGRRDLNLSDLPEERIEVGCGSFTAALDGSNLDHLTSLRLGRDGGSGLGTTPSA